MRINKRSKKGQTWSTDVMVGVIAFVLAFGLFFYVLSIKANVETVRELKSEGNVLPVMLVSSEPDTESTLVFVINNKVDIERLENVAAMNYTHFKALLGIKNHFCIFFEDEDGNLVNISDVIQKTAAGIGNPYANVSGIPCGA